MPISNDVPLMQPKYSERKPPTTGNSLLFINPISKYASTQIGVSNTAKTIFPSMALKPMTPDESEPSHTIAVAADPLGEGTYSIVDVPSLKLFAAVHRVVPFTRSNPVVLPGADAMRMGSVTFCGSM